MKKALFVGATVVGAILVARRLGKSGGFTVERMLERMPDDSPPKWMFTNVATIRRNTELILDQLKEERGVQTSAA